MSVNWSKKDFARRLRTTVIDACELREGDIVYEDGNPIGVARLVTNGDMIEIYDEDKNGWGHRYDTKVSILVREALRAP